MQIGCFGCDTKIEGDDSDTIVERFLAHAAAEHQWDYSEQSLRNYALNNAEAPERLSGSTERLAAIGTVTVHPVTEERLDDWRDFFDHDGFADNADWASCYCLSRHIDEPEHAELYWKDSREGMVDRLQAGTAFGYLAYVDGRPAGWVNASSRSDYIKAYRLADPGGPDSSTVVGVTCFVIAPPYRRHGIAGALLDAVVAGAASRGADWVEGYPSNNPEGTESMHLFRGPRSMYEARGFKTVEVREVDTIMRRPA
jgi:GNAT superfamily N-acetyltransferase